MPIIHNPLLQSLIRPTYSVDDLDAIARLLEQKGTLNFPTLSTGLFSASLVTPGSQHTNYHFAWVRDNVHIAYAHFVNGRPKVAVRTAQALCTYFGQHKDRFERIIHNPALKEDPMQRPHVRFDGDTFAEIDVKWAHAQNDALGYFVWLYGLLANDGALTVDAEALAVLKLFPPYFEAIRYWEDEDSGHWEEAPKVSASSIGVVVGGLKQLQRLPLAGRMVPGQVESLIAHGTAALHRILPSECVQPDPAKNRRYDSALLFLAYPLRTVEGQAADAIIADVTTHLQGDYGIKRYLGDSFWCEDYKQVPEDKRTVDYSNDMGARDALLKPGGEAQWCLFDPLLSAYFGREYQATGRAADLERQTEYLNRSLGQITGPDSPFGAFKCPELYYREQGRMETSDSTPLMWTQANLWVALEMMKESLQRAT